VEACPESGYAGGPPTRLRPWSWLSCRAVR